MADRDMVNNIDAEEVLAETAITTNTTTASSINDSKGFESITYLINLTNVTDGDFTIRVVEGDDSGLSDGADAASTRLLGSLTFAAADSGNMLRVGYVGEKNFQRLEIDSLNVSTGATLDVKVVKGHPLTAPVANP